MEDKTEVFRSNTLMILIPGIFFGSALILRATDDLVMLLWILLGIGGLTTIAVVGSFTTLIITGKEIRIRNMKKSHVIHVNEITRQSKKISTAKGIESVTWKLHLKDGGVVSVSSDLFKEKEKLKESLDSFLKHTPKK